VKQALTQPRPVEVTVAVQSKVGVLSFIPDVEFQYEEEGWDNHLDFQLVFHRADMDPGRYCWDADGVVNEFAWLVSA
jgi:hypothetical protein